MPPLYEVHDMCTTACLCIFQWFGIGQNQHTLYNFVPSWLRTHVLLPHSWADELGYVPKISGEGPSRGTCGRCSAGLCRVLTRVKVVPISFLHLDHFSVVPCWAENQAELTVQLEESDREMVLGLCLAQFLRILDRQHQAFSITGQGGWAWTLTCDKREHPTFCCHMMQAVWWCLKIPKSDIADRLLQSVLKSGYFPWRLLYDLPVSNCWISRPASLSPKALLLRLETLAQMGIRVPEVRQKKILFQRFGSDFGRAIFNDPCIKR